MKVRRFLVLWYWVMVVPYYQQTNTSLFLIKEFETPFQPWTTSYMKMVPICDSLKNHFQPIIRHFITTTGFFLYMYFIILWTRHRILKFLKKWQFLLIFFFNFQKEEWILDFLKNSFLYYFSNFRTLGIITLLVFKIMVYYL